MKLQLVTKPLSEVKNEYLVLPIFEDEKPKFNGVVTDFMADNPKFGKTNETQLLYSKNKKIILLGLGKKDKFNFEILQNWAGTATRFLLNKTKIATIILPAADTLSPDQMGQAVTIGIEIGQFDITKEYKSEYEPAKLTTLELIVEKADRGYQEGIRKGQIISESINLVKTLGDKPANEMTPTYFMQQAKKLAKENKLKITVIDEKQAKRLGMGAFCGVAQGSEEPSFMIALEYIGNLKSKEKWGLAGKGITFDTGGISLKPASSMHEMKYDMCGAATVLATIVALSQLKVKANVVGVMAVTENLPGGKAQRPGDVVKTLSGKTAEILNTDAEGRLVLVDALTYAQKTLKATKLIDLATLTGAIIVALGDFYTGLFTNDPKFAQELIVTGSEVGEKYWEMPLTEEYNEMIKSDIADITNIGHGGSMPGAAGSITAAKFLEAVIVDKPWIHLDIAGTAWDLKPRPFRNLGATGVGVKTLVKLISK